MELTRQASRRAEEQRSMSYPEGYLKGIELFNASQFWHAHEEWELVWKSETGESRRFIQGLIQTAAALVHWQRGNPRGLQLNWGKARPKLSATPSPYWGLQLEPLLDSMDGLAAGRHAAPPALELY
jgi:uncharacterized protein